MGVTQTGLTVTFTHILNQQSLHIAYVLSRCLAQNARIVDVSPEAEAEFVNDFNKQAKADIEFFKACTPGYYNNEGKPEDEGTVLQSSAYGGGCEAFFRLAREWRSDGDLRGLEIEADETDVGSGS
jgi:cyclohexanone monooxygenase